MSNNSIGNNSFQHPQDLFSSPSIQRNNNNSGNYGKTSNNASYTSFQSPFLSPKPIIRNSVAISPIPVHLLKPAPGHILNLQDSPINASSK